MKNNHFNLDMSLEEREKKLAEMSDKDIVYDEDSPSLNDIDLKKIGVVNFSKQTKIPKSMRFDPELYKWFEEESRKYDIPTQTLIHRVLEAYKDSQ